MPNTGTCYRIANIWKHHVLTAENRAAAGDILLKAMSHKTWQPARIAGLVCAVLTCFLIVGCGEGVSSQRASADDPHLKFVADSYGLFLKEHRRPPQDDAEFREFISRLAADDPHAKDHTVDELLTSSRDGKVFVLVTQENAPAAGTAIAAYEQAGVDGRRLVADTAGNIQEVDEASFQTMVPGTP